MKQDELEVSEAPPTEGVAAQFDTPSFSRRQVMVALGSVSLLVALTGLVREAMRFLTPPVSQARPMLVTGGLPGDYPIGQLTPLTNGPVFIGRDEGGLFALSAICTHLGCTVAREVQPAPGVATSGEGLVCPCHGSHFAADGTPLAGPASQALPRLALTLNDDGLVEVNLDEVVEPDFRVKI